MLVMPSLNHYIYNTSKTNKFQYYTVNKKIFSEETVYTTLYHGFRVKPYNTKITSEVWSQGFKLFSKLPLGLKQNPQSEDFTAFPSFIFIYTQ